MATKIYDDRWIAETFKRMATAIRAQVRPQLPIGLIGVRTRGAEMADRLADELRKGGDNPQVGYLDPTMFRDDLHIGTGVRGIKSTDLNFDVSDFNIVLIDDVLLTGRSVRAALAAVFHYGRPALVRLCVMVDRGGRELPIQPDICGAKIDIPDGGWVRVKLQKTDNRPDAVYVLAAGDAEP